MKTLAVAAMAMALSATSARAQITMTTSPAQQNTAFGVEPMVRVTSTFRTTIAVPEPQAIPDAKAQETARRALYGMAEGECATLSEVFQAECRLSNVSMLVLAPIGSVPPNTMSATATYDLRPRAAASGR